MASRIVEIPSLIDKYLPIDSFADANEVAKYMFHQKNVLDACWYSNKFTNGVLSDVSAGAVQAALSFNNTMPKNEFYTVNYQYISALLSQETLNSNLIKMLSDTGSTGLAKQFITHRYAGLSGIVLLAIGDKKALPFLSELCGMTKLSKEEEKAFFEYGVR